MFHFFLCNYELISAYHMTPWSRSSYQSYKIRWWRVSDGWWAQSVGYIPNLTYTLLLKSYPRKSTINEKICAVCLFSVASFCVPTPVSLSPECVLMMLLWLKYGFLGPHCSHFPFRFSGFCKFKTELWNL